MSITLEQLTKRYEGHAVVHHVSLEIHEHEFFVLLGPSGSGKSTILRMIAGLTELDQGSIALHGRNVTDLPPQHRGIGFVFQNYALFQHMSVAENIEFALKIRKIPAQQRRLRRNELLYLVGLSGLGDRMPRQLSGGQQQRVALARALAHQPRVLLLDEPFGALDAKIRTELRRNLRQIQQELGITTIFVTHDQEEGFELADRMGIMNMGRLLEVGTPQELYQRPQTEFVATFLGTANILRGRCYEDQIQFGKIEIPLQTTASQPIPTQDVHVLFRPEDVVISSQPSSIPDIALGSGWIEHTIFSGAYERLKIRMNGYEHLSSDLIPLASSSSFGEPDLIIECIRSQKQARTDTFMPGDQVWVGIQRFHVLSQPSLKLLLLTDGRPAGNRALEIGAYIAKQAHARTTLVGYGSPNLHLLKMQLQTIQEELGNSLPVLETSIVNQHLETVLLQESELFPYDLLIHSLPSQSPLHLIEQLLQAGQHHLLLIPETTKQPRLNHALICLTGGEPGKDNVLFASQILHHVGASATLFSVVPEGRDHVRIEAFLQDGLQVLKQHNIPAQMVLRKGVVTPMIQAELAQGIYDMLIVGAPLPDRGNRLELSATLRDLIRSVAVPVLVVRSCYATEQTLAFKQHHYLEEVVR